MNFPPRPSYSIPLPSGRVLELGSRPLVMGILNITPDSFADASPLSKPEAAIEAALRMEAAGADIIDVGGESTRPGADPVTVADELARVMPVIGPLVRQLRVPISIDTYKADVAQAALGEGAVIVNDVSGLLFDPALPHVVARAGAALVVMHNRGLPKEMYARASYGDAIADEVSEELRQAIGRAEAGGVRADQVIVDPGIGFAKRASHSYGVLARLSEIQASLNRPLLAGPSRKSFMREAVGERPAAERDWGTAAAVTAAVLAGAHIVRVHAVAEMVQVVRVAEEIRRSGSGEQGPSIVREPRA